MIDILLAGDDEAVSNRVPGLTEVVGHHSSAGWL
jgi:hypothetical protein